MKVRTFAFTLATALPLLAAAGTNTPAAPQGEWDSLQAGFAAMLNHEPVTTPGTVTAVDCTLPVKAARSDTREWDSLQAGFEAMLASRPAAGKVAARCLSVYRTVADASATRHSGQQQKSEDGAGAQTSRTGTTSCNPMLAPC